MRGRPPKPTQIKIMEGNPGKRELNPFEPIAPIGHIECPDFLDDYGQRAWDAMAKNMQEMNLLSTADLDAMAMYCTLFSRWLKCEKIIQKEGMTFEILTEEGDVKYAQQRPEIGISNNCIKQMNQIAQQFGMTPSSRSRLMVLNGNKDSKEISLEDLLA